MRGQRAKGKGHERVKQSQREYKANRLIKLFAGIKMAKKKNVKGERRKK